MWVCIMEKSDRNGRTATSAKVVSYKVHNSKKKLLLVGNGASSHCFGIQLGKVFQPEDAERIVAVFSSGRF
jgi:hypothetical protein